MNLKKAVVSKKDWANPCPVCTQKPRVAFLYSRNAGKWVGLCWCGEICAADSFVDLKEQWREYTKEARRDLKERGNA